MSWRIASNPGLQGDLRIYQAAARVHAEGRSPYEPGALTGAGGNTQQLPFVYPPAVLPLLRPLIVFDYRTTYFLFFVLKMAAVAALIALWRRRLFPGDWAGACLYLLCALGYGQTIKTDVRAGNISVFEQLLIWGAALAFLRRRQFVYAGLIAAAALFKPITAALLLLLLVDRGRRNVTALTAAVLGLAAVHGISAGVHPELFGAFVRNAGGLDDRGSVNPALMALIRDGLERIGSNATGFVDEMIYGLAALLIGLTSLTVFRRLDLAENRESNNRESNDRRLLFLFFFTYALCAPRFKDYSYILLIPPSVHVVMNVLRSVGARALALALLCTHLFAYQSWVAALVLFTAYVAHLLRPARRPPAPVAAPGPA